MTTPEIIWLSPKAWERFVAAIENPPEPAPALRKLMAKRPIRPPG